MNTLAAISLGMIIGGLTVLVLVILWAMMTRSGQISREEEGRSYSVTRSRENMKKYREPSTKPTPPKPGRC